MTREEAKAWVPILQAFAEGKPIERKYGEGVWTQVNKVHVNRNFPDDYRIKPEPKYRPFKTREECWEEMLKHEPFGWVVSQETGTKYLINTLYAEEVRYTHFTCKFCELLDNNTTFIDGTPFGIKE